MELKDIIQEFTKYGPKGLLLLSIVLIIITIVKSEWFGKLFTKVSRQLVEYFMKKKIDTESGPKLITESDIINHDIFNYIDFWMYSKVPTFQFSTEYRPIVFRKYLNIFLKKHIENFFRVYSMQRNL